MEILQQPLVANHESPISNLLSLFFPMSYRFTLRWTLVGLLCAACLLGIGVFIEELRPAPPVQQQVSIDDLMAAGEMPMSEQGTGMQVINGTTLALKLDPYPARASVPATLTLVTIPSTGRAQAEGAPVLLVAPVAQVDAREFVMARQADQSYAAQGVFFPQPGRWRLRVDVNVGDDTPASMMTTVEVK